MGARQSKTRRVVLYTSATWWRGGAISFVHIARGLARHGFDPHVVSTCAPLTQEFANAGMAVTEVPRRAHEALRLRRLLTALGASALIVDCSHDLRVGTRAVVGTRIALIHRYNHFAPNPPADLLIRIAYGWVLRDLVFLSTSARERVLDDRPFMRRVPSTTIYEGVDIERFRPCDVAAAAFRAQFHLGAEPFLLAVGALAPEKRYAMLFDAMARLDPNRPLLVICGEGPDELPLRREAERQSIRVRFLGRVPQHVLVGAYSAALALVHLGAVETFGLAVLEAMSCARPVIASAGGAVPEVIGADGRCGTLVPTDSVAGIADAVRRLLDDPASALQRGREARERARRRFSLQAMEDRYAELVAGSTVGASPNQPTKSAAPR